MPRIHWPAYQTCEPLIHRHLGRPAVVMGGGLSLVEGMAADLPADAVYLTANDHGARYFRRRGLPQRCEYMVTADADERRWRRDILRGGDGSAWNIPLVSRHMFGDYRLLYMPRPESGIAAAWLARLMGCCPIIVLGMDCYSSGTYHDDAKAVSFGKNLAPADHCRYWLEFSRAWRGPYRAIGCYPPLRALLGDYDPAEVIRYSVPAAQALRADLQCIRCRVTRDTVIMHRPFPAGVELDLRFREAQELERDRRGHRI